MEYRHQTDSQTDDQTDRQIDSQTHNENNKGVVLMPASGSKILSTLLPLLGSTTVAVVATVLISNGGITENVSGSKAPWEEFYSVFGMIYAIVSGFLLVEVLNRFNNLSEVVESELNAIGDVRDFLIYMDGQEDKKKTVNRELQEYVHSVATVEWHDMNDDRAALNSDTSKELYDIMYAVNELEINNESDRSALHFLINELSSITTLRTQRISIANHSLPPQLKHLLLFMSAVLVIAFMINTTPVLWVQCFMVGSITACVHLLYLVIADLDHPFTGLWTINVRPLIELQNSFDVD